MKRAISSGACLLAFVIGSGQLVAQTSWNGGTGDWHTPANWSSGVPDSSTNTTIGGGTVNLTGGGSNLDGTTANLDITGFTTLDVSSGRTLSVSGDFTASSGNKTIQGGGNIEIQGTSSFGSTVVTGGGELRLNGTATISPSSSFAVSKNVVSNGDTNWDNFSIAITGSTWTNASGATFTRNHNVGSVRMDFASNGRFQNDGTFVKTGGGTFDVQAGVSNGFENGRFINNGTIRVEQGSMTIHNYPGSGVLGNVVFENNGSIEVANDATFDLSHSETIAFNGGNLGGSGTISDSVTMTGGTLSPGNSPGQLNINGDLGLDNTTLNIELGGTAQGTEFDYLNVSGNTTLTGTTNVVVSFVNGFENTISNGDSFTVLNTAGFPNAPNIGTNITFDFTALNGDFQVDFTGNGGAGSGITFSSFTAVPEPTSFGLFALSAAGWVLSRRRRV